ncbi:hypothetical protein EJ110_NYTH57547 [Nymphaea thermarum]|nr:hypothetical protein EJ110_NYTH57547 [Nymphaea thermarum]
MDSTNFPNISEAQVLFLKKTFQNLKKSSMSVMEYIGRMKAITDQLAVIGSAISAKDKVQQLTDGLGTDFDMFTIALQCLLQLPTFEEL